MIGCDQIRWVHLEGNPPHAGLASVSISALTVRLLASTLVENLLQISVGFWGRFE